VMVLGSSYMVGCYLFNDCGKLWIVCISVQSLVDMAPKYILEQFLEAELLVNITEHQVNV